MFVQSRYQTHGRQPGLVTQTIPLPTPRSRGPLLLHRRRCFKVPDLGPGWSVLRRGREGTVPGVEGVTVLVVPVVILRGVPRRMLLGLPLDGQENEPLEFVLDVPLPPARLS